MNLTNILKDYNKKNKKNKQDESLLNINYDNLYNNKKNNEIIKNKNDEHFLSYDIIPKFFSKPLPKLPNEEEDEEEEEEEDEEMEQNDNIKSLAKARFLREKYLNICHDNELDNLWDILEKYSFSPQYNNNTNNMMMLKAVNNKLKNTQDMMKISPRSVSSTINSNLRLDYKNFQKIKNELKLIKLKRFFKANVFLSLYRDEFGTINTEELYRLINRVSFMEKYRIILEEYDEDNNGFLSEVALEEFIFNQIGSIPALSSVQESFAPFYCFTVSAKFFFFLDDRKRGRISIAKLARSNLLWEFIHDHSAQSWFSIDNAARVYNKYLDLDKDHNGMLNQVELSEYYDEFNAFTIRLTRTIIRRIFQENTVYRAANDPSSAEMDYKGFLQFCLAMENKHTKQGIAYFFRLLDLKKLNYIDSNDISYFFREVHHCLFLANIEPPLSEDVIVEIFDMVKPKIQGRITLEDLIESKMGENIINMLTDVNGFFVYDNRESLSHDQQEEEEEEEEEYENMNIF